MITREEAAAEATQFEGLETLVITLTPALAQTFLNKNASNRPINKANVNAYARDMAAGNFHPMFDPLAFDPPYGWHLRRQP